MKKIFLSFLIVCLLAGCNGEKASNIQTIHYEEYTTFLNEKEKVENDSEFDAGSNIDSINQKEANLENLFVLAKIWGYLKYYHPNVAKGSYNWDYELFRAMEAILAVTKQEERDKILCNWLTSLGTFSIESDHEAKDPPLYKAEADLSWLEDFCFSEELKLKLLDIKKGKRESNRYCFISYDGLNPLFEYEEPYTFMSDPDTGFRLLALFRYWNIIEYYFPYKYLIGENWDDVLKEYIPRFINSRGEKDYIFLVLELTTKIRDGQSDLVPRAKKIPDYRGYNLAPVDLAVVEGRVVVIDRNYNPSAFSELRCGDIVVRINNESVESIIEGNLKYMPGSNYAAKLADLSFLMRTNDNSLSVDYERDGIIDSTKVTCLPTRGYEWTFLHRIYSKDKVIFFLPESDLAYLCPGANESEFLEKQENIMNKIKDTRGLILDLRQYTSDMFIDDLTRLLLPQPRYYVRYTRTGILNPGSFTLSKSAYAGRVRDNYYKGKVVVLIDEGTISGAELMVMALQTVPDVTLIGSNTAGAVGDISGFPLPGGLRAYISGSGVYYPDGREIQRIGIAPDIYVRPTIQGIREGRDEVLERAIEFISGNG